jgi:hypothetical protein
MLEKYRINTNIGDEQHLIVELKQDFDLLEILSLKFTQKEAYTSLCADYGVVCGRVTANNGFGIPNAKVSIFIPSDGNIDDTVINDLYPYNDINERNKDGYRYNLLPNKKQHSGHTPVGTFPSQEDILNREEILEVYEKYYNFTVKTNQSGDFMIWGIPLGSQTLHIDIDLSDMGCFSLRPYDFIKKGYNKEQFDRIYNFKSSTDLDGLPQIVSFDKTIEVIPFWGSTDICNIGITRTDFDLSNIGIKIEPISLVLASSITDEKNSAIKRSGVIRKNTGSKCSLQTNEGKLECIRFTRNKVYGSDNQVLYPELENYNIEETIDENGVIMAVIPMNRDYVITNEYGEQEITNETNKGIPTSTTARMRFSLNIDGNKTTTAKYLVPNIREFNSNSNGSFNKGDEYNEGILSSYIFSDVFEDYINVPRKSNLNFNSTGFGTNVKNYKKDLILGTNNNNIPEDYFYKFIYGKVYTVSSFQSSHYEVSAIGSVFGTSRKDAFLGIKDIKPTIEEDCSTSTNYFPTNFAYRNNVKFSITLSNLVLFSQYILLLVLNTLTETLGRVIFNIGLGLIRISVLGIGDIGRNFIESAFKIQESNQKILSLSTYPDCEECTIDSDNSSISNVNDNYCRIGEIKMEILPFNNNLYFFVRNNDINNWLNTQTTANSSYLSYLFQGDSAKMTDAQCNNSFILTKGQLPNLGFLNTTSTNEKRIIGEVYSINENIEKENFNKFNIIFSNVFNNLNDKSFGYYDITIPTAPKISIKKEISGSTLSFTIVNNLGQPTTVFEDVIITFETIYTDCNFVITLETKQVQIKNGNSSITFNLAKPSCTNGNNQTNIFKKIISISTNYPLYTTPTGEEGTTISGLGFYFSYDDWNILSGMEITNDNINTIKNTNIAIRFLDRDYTLDGNLSNQINIEQGCEKYDKFYDEENNQYKFLYGVFDYGENSVPVNDGDINLLTDNGRRLNGNYNDVPGYGLTLFREGLTPPNPNYSLLATISGADDTFRLPNVINLGGDIIKFDKKTKSGLTEIRDGVITIVPVIRGKSNNSTVIKEWYKRKKITAFFCGGIVNYSFIDNWLHGLLYFFKFDFKIKWDDFDNFDLNVRQSKYPRELIFFNILDNTFYFRSTPFNITQGFKGQDYNGYKEILRPTTFYDIGARDEYFKEICYDPNINSMSSVVRDITSTSYQDPSTIVEYAINNKLDSSNNKLEIEDFFNKGVYGDKLSTLNGDLIQLFSINSEVGIEAFDLDSPQYFIYNNEFMDIENPSFGTYFKNNGIYGPTAIDFKLDDNGRYIRENLNYRLGNMSQNVPFFLWDKKGVGFGQYSNLANLQQWDRTAIASMKLQRIKSINNINATTTNYIFNGNNEEYLLKPITITHDSFYFSGNTSDSLERFEVVSLNIPTNANSFIEGDLWLKVTEGTIKDPIIGDIYVVVNKMWVKQGKQYAKNVYETFLAQTQNNYTGNKQVLSTPFLFYFGLRPHKTALDELIKYYGPKIK